MALRRVPIETWQMILRYTIAVPVFFETSPVEECGIDEYRKNYYNDQPYWESERHRNILRRVCSAWKHYLQRFNHRYIILGDIGASCVPLIAITKAIRLSHYGSYINALQYREILERAMVENANDWALEILQMGNPDLRNLLQESGRIPRLGSISYGEDVDLPAYHKYPLKHCSINGVPSDNGTPLNPSQLSQLTSLRILTSTLAPLLACDFPSLKHLSIIFSVTDDSILSPRDFISLLRVTGKNLVTFLDNSPLSNETIPDEMWSLCPKIERFQTGLIWPVAVKIPPSLRLIQLAPDVCNNTLPPSASRLPATALSRAGTKSVRIGDTWYSEAGPKRAVAYVEYAMNHGLTCYDAYGISFQTFIVSTLLNRKKGFSWPPKETYRPLKEF